jgi:CDP-glycerol glycerophosphotransferase
MKNDDKMIDLMLSGSKHFTNVCRNAFKYNGEILKCGCPKNDNIINADKTKAKKQVKKDLDIKEDNILLYMPTFRTDYSTDPYNIDLDKVKKSLEKNTGKSWKVLCKMHPNVQNKHKNINCTDYISIDKYNNTQQAIAACDILISDYSSVLFDAMLANKTVLVYANDEELYRKNERGLYFNLSDLPFPYFKSSAEIVRYINQDKLKHAKDNYRQFFKEQDVYTEGNASKIVADYISKICFNK